MSSLSLENDGSVGRPGSSSVSGGPVSESGLITRDSAIVMRELTDCKVELQQKYYDFDAYLADILDKYVDTDLIHRESNMMEARRIANNWSRLYCNHTNPYGDESKMQYRYSEYNDLGRVELISELMKWSKPSEFEVDFLYSRAKEVLDLACTLDDLELGEVEGTESETEDHALFIENGVFHSILMKIYLWFANLACIADRSPLPEPRLARYGTNFRTMWHGRPTETAAAAAADREKTAKAKASQVKKG